MSSALAPLFMSRSIKSFSRLSQLCYGLPLRQYVSRTLSLAGAPEFPTLARHFAKLVSFPLAQTGEGISECELVAWAVKPGDVVSPFDKLCDVQSDKAAIEITSRYGGKVLALHHVMGTMVKVGAPLVDIEVADDVQVAAEHLASAPAVAAVLADNRSTAGLCGSSAGGAGDSTTRPASAMITANKVAVQVAPETPVPQPAPPAGGRAASAAGTTAAVPPSQFARMESPQTPHSFGSASGRFRIQASPAVRAFARDSGVDIGLVTGSGPGGRITRADVLQFVEQQQQQQGGLPLASAWQQRPAKEEGEEEEDGDGEEGRVVLQASDFLGGATTGPVAQAAAAAGGSSSYAAAAATGYRSSRGRSVEELLAQYKRLAVGASGSQPSPPRGGASAAPAGGGGGGEGLSQAVPLRGYRRAMVASMTAAASVPVFHFHDEVILDRLMAAREALRVDHSLRAAGLKLTVLPLLLKALSVALKQHPHINASLAPGGTELLLHPHHNIGVAMATPTGLVVPNIKQVERKSVAQVASELHVLQQLAAVGRLPQEALVAGTITVSNIGTIGGTYATPLVTPPEVAIVALGRLQMLPRYPPASPAVLLGGPLQPPGPLRGAAAAAGSGGGSGGSLGSIPTPLPVSVMPISWGADHRVVDGAALAAFSNSWKELLEQPDRLLLHLA